MNRLPFRALAVLPSPSSVAQITAQRGARKLVRVKNYEELPPGIEIHNDRASSVGVLLRRDPVILPEPTPFEAAYAAHVDELRLEAARPLASDFFFKKGTNDEQLFREAQRLEREGASRSGSASVDSKTDSEGDNNEASAKSATENPFAAYDGPLAPRTSEADANGDITTLSRAFDKPVFLVVRKKGEESVWKFPESPVKSTELLHEVGWISSVLSAPLFLGPTFLLLLRNTGCGSILERRL